MYERKAAPWVVGCLLLLGCLAFGLRSLAQRQNASNEIQGLWRIGYDVKLDADAPGVRVQLTVPRDTPNVKIVRQNLSYSELQNERPRTSNAQTRLSLIAPRPGYYEVSARFDLDLRRPGSGPSNVESAPTSRDIDRWLRSTPSIQIENDTVLSTLGRIKDSGDTIRELLEKIFAYCLSEIDAIDASDEPTDAATVLRASSGSPIGKVHAMLALCRAAKLPARLVTGFEIREVPEPPLDYWLEVFIESTWEAYDPVHGHARQMPPEFIPVGRESEQIVVVSEHGRAEVEYVIHRVGERGFASSTGQHPADIFDLNRLPLSMHETLSVILLLPLGALVTALFQTVIGIRTIGTFSPTLIALSFVLADWHTGVAVFALVIMVGLISRAALDRLKLLMVPRLGFMLTLVVVFLIFTISILDYLRFTPSHQAVLLPMVILTMTVERFYVASAEDGIRAAVKLMLGTMLVSFCCYLTLSWHRVGTLVFQFPEVHLITLAAFVYLGRYTGYRLTELWRFRDLLPERESH